MAAKKSGGRKYGKAASKSVRSAMKRRKTGTLKSGKRGGGTTKKVTSRKQAIAIGLSEARAKGAKVPARKKSAAKKGGARKSAAKKGGARKAASKGGARKSTRKSASKGTRKTTRKSTRKRAAKKSS